MARLTRNLLKPIRMAEYIFVAKSFKKSPLYIVIRHMIPNIFLTILSRMILSIPEFIFYESFLSYLGIGVQPPDTSWGSLISNAQSNFMFHPYQLLFSGLFLILIMLSVTWMGECIGTKSTAKEFVEDAFSKKHLLARMDSSSEHLLQVQNLSVHYSNSLDESVKNVSFEIPELIEQIAIANILSLCDNEILLAKQKLNKFRHQKKGLMQVLLTGKKRVNI